MKRLLRWRRLRWFAFGALIRFLLKRSTARSVDRASADLEQRLPTPVRRALDVVPADAIRAGGSAMVAARTAKRVATGTRRATRAASDGRRQAAGGLRRIRSIGDEIADEAELKRRQLRAQYLRATRGQAEADEAMLDRRRPDHEPDHEQVTDEYPDGPPRPKDPVGSGRWRADRFVDPRPVDRVQRSYRPRPKPWAR